MPLTTAMQMRLAHEIALGIAYLHSCKLLHRDIKPANVMLDAGYHAKVGDFGLVTRFGSEKTAAVGSPRYMSPEVLFESYTYKADIFSYGMLLYELLHVELPFANLSAFNALMRVTELQRPQVCTSVHLPILSSLVPRARTDRGSTPTWPSSPPFHAPPAMLLCSGQSSRGACHLATGSSAA